MTISNFLEEIKTIDKNNKNAILLHSFGQNYISDLEQYASSQDYNTHILKLNLSLYSDIIGMNYITPEKENALEAKWISKIKEDIKNGIKTLVVIEGVQFSSPDILNALFNLILTGKYDKYSFPTTEENKPFIVLAMIKENTDINQPYFFNSNKINPFTLKEFCSVDFSN